MNAPAVKREQSLLQNMHEQIKLLRLATADQDTLYALAQNLEKYYLLADEGLIRGIVHIHSANQSLHAIMTLLLACPEDRQIHCEQIAALLEPIRQELLTGFTQISEVM
ncbi:hypothetical protein [Chromobacterium sp. Beijing]|uniref:hypothetical protein n=1 Tax=Chromobacterium sp. Beijing TaxID=2735795 RepID=UPI001F3E6A94|nr:hypothetical protein [Chromobacterium sp. Beijing]UJB32705.1 hypothetical protein HQN78_17605 [Chromobacterium sp. Beijing]